MLNKGRCGGHLVHFVVFTVASVLSQGMIFFGLSLSFHWQEEQKAHYRVSASKYNATTLDAVK